MLPFRSSVDRVLAGWLFGVLAAVLLALLSLALINRLVYGPDGQVRAYFSAAQEGDGGKVLGILGTPVPQGNAAMLDGPALASAFAALEDPKPLKTEITDGGSRARVTVGYRVDGQDRTTDFHLHKVGSYWGVFDRWAIDQEALASVRVESVTGAATLNGRKVPVDGGTQDFPVFFPGKYTVTYESALYSAASESALVTAETDRPELHIRLEPSETALASIQQQVKTYLDTCAAQNSLYPAGCPFEYDFAGRVSGDVTWLVTDYPDPQVDFSRGSWSLGQGSGSAEISFTALDLYTGETRQVTQAVPFKLSGTLTAKDEAITFTPAP